MDNSASRDETRDVPPVLQRVRETRADVDDSELAELDDRVVALFELFGRTHGLSILRLFALEGGPWRFSELEARLDASPHTISQRLTDLTEAGFLERRAYDENPPRVEYSWTASARDLSPAMQTVYEWALEHDLGPAETDR